MDSREALDLDLNRYLSKLQQHWFPVVSIFGTTVVLACLATVLVKPSYVAAGKLRFKVDQTPLFQEIDTESGELRPLVSTQNPLSTEIEVIYAKPLLQNMIDDLDLTNPEGEPLEPEDVLARLDVSILGGTDILKIAYESDLPQESADVVNTLMRLYIYRDIQSQRTRAIAARQFIAQQLPQRETVVREAEEELSRFKRRHNIVDLEIESETTVTEISKLDSDITSTRADLEEAIARSAILKTQVGLENQDAIAVSKLSQSSAAKEVLRELQSVERQLTIAREIYQDNFPSVISLKSRQAALQSLLQQQSQKTLQNRNSAPTTRVELDDPQQSSIKDFLTAEVQRQSLGKRLNSLMRKRSSYSQRTQALPKLRQTLRELARKSQAAQSTYETLLKKLQELQVAENVNSSNATIIENALVPTKGNTIQKKAAIVAFGILLGAFLATASVPILSARQPRSRQASKEIEDLFDYPLWAVIPHVKDRNAVGEHDTNPLVDIVGAMHRMIQEHPQLLNTEPALKTIAVTSAESQEGKSTIAAHLAVAMSQMGKRVLLVDANLRQPKQHKLFKLSNDLGLSNVIQDTSIRFPEIEMTINPVMKNLNVFTSGTQPANPIGILSCERMNLLLQYLSWTYDVVILDTSPLLDIDGTSALGNMADGILLVTDLMVTHTDKTITMVKEIVIRSEQNVIGMIVNNATGMEYSNAYVSNIEDNSEFIQKNPIASERINLLYQKK